MIKIILIFLTDALCGMMETLVNWFLNVFSLDMSKYLEAFPILGDTYDIFKGISYGLILTLTAFALIKFMEPSLFGSMPDETPSGTLLWAGFATLGVYAGNYVLEIIIDIAKAAYMEFDKLGEGKQFILSDIINKGVEAFKLTLAGEFLKFVLVVLCCYELIRLLFEIVERFLLVGVLTFTSPPFFALLASPETRGSFLSWFKMFVSSCVMMALSAYFLRLILIALNFSNNISILESPSAYTVRMMLIYGMCKAAQKVDSYLAQIGLGAAQMGSIMDEMASASHAVAGAVTGAKRTAAKTVSVLGSHTAAGRMIRDTGMAAMDAIKSGDSVSTVMAKAKSAYEDNGGAKGFIPGYSTAHNLKNAAGESNVLKAAVRYKTDSYQTHNKEAARARHRKSYEEKQKKPQS